MNGLRNDIKTKFKRINWLQFPWGHQKNYGLATIPKKSRKKAWQNWKNFWKNMPLSEALYYLLKIKEFNTSSRKKLQ